MHCLIKGELTIIKASWAFFIIRTNLPDSGAFLYWGEKMLENLENGVLLLGK